jgi:hypothetical protein
MQIIIDVADDTGAITIAIDGKEPMPVKTAEEAMEMIKSLLPSGMSEEDMWNEEAAMADTKMKPMGGQMGEM